VSVCSWLILIVRFGELAAQSPAPWIGTWTLDVVTSAGAAPMPYKRGSRHIAALPDGTVTIIDDLVRNRGGVLHTEWTGKFDGLDYQVQGVEVVLTNAIRRVDERTCELVQRLDGRVIARVRLELAADGTMLTATSMGNAGTTTTVYRKSG
jgi:hypothetical protein